MTIKAKMATFSSVASILLLCSCGGVQRNINIMENSCAVENSVSVMAEETTEKDVSSQSETALSVAEASVTTMSQTARTALAETSEETTTTPVQEETSESKCECISLKDLTISLDMDVSKPSGLSKEDFVTLINKLKYDYKGYYKRNAELIWSLCQEYSMNEIFACGIIAQESGWAKVAGWGKNNYFGIYGGKYATEEEGLTKFIQLVGNQYLKEEGKYYHGKTMQAVGRSYCDADRWPKEVYGCMKLIMKCI